MKRWLDMRELHTIIASLRLWQRAKGEASPVLLDIASGGGAFEPLDDEEVEALTSSLNDGTTPMAQPVLGDAEAKDAIEFVRTVAEQTTIKPYSSPVGKTYELTDQEEHHNDTILRARVLYDKHHLPKDEYEAPDTGQVFDKHMS